MPSPLADSRLRISSQKRGSVKWFGTYFFFYWCFQAKCETCTERIARQTNAFRGNCIVKEKRKRYQSCIISGTRKKKNLRFLVSAQTMLGQCIFSVAYFVWEEACKYMSWAYEIEKKKKIWIIVRVKEIEWRRNKTYFLYLILSWSDFTGWCCQYQMLMFYKSLYNFFFIKLRILSENNNKIFQAL